MLKPFTSLVEQSTKASETTDPFGAIFEEGIPELAEKLTENIPGNFGSNSELVIPPLPNEAEMAKRAGSIPSLLQKGATLESTPDLQASYYNDGRALRFVEGSAKLNLDGKVFYYRLVLSGEEFPDSMRGPNNISKMPSKKQLLPSVLPFFRINRIEGYEYRSLIDSHQGVFVTNKDHDSWNKPKVLQKVGNSNFDTPEFTEEEVQELFNIGYEKLL